MGEEQVLSEELDYLAWLARINEKLTFLRMSIYEHREISDDDQCLLKIFYKLWRDGEYPLYLTKFDLPIQTVTQNDLFSENISATMSVKIDGTELVIESSEIKKEKEDDTEVEHGG